VPTKGGSAQPSKRHESVLILLGSASDQPVATKVTDTLRSLGIPFRLRVASAHRSPKLVLQEMDQSPAKVLIGIAGLSAALPGVMAAHTLRPVIGIPAGSSVALDSILSVIQMPKGVPVAAVGLDNGVNAALLAARILALSDDALQQRLQAYADKARIEIEALEPQH